ncbi:hypothetical protein C8F01DRAFT_1237944 [Mycena amicta]|nr:hypothetical protein C8F01DRAFT_1237944 [Mycena amicta]
MDLDGQKTTMNKESEEHEQSIEETYLALESTRTSSLAFSLQERLPGRTSEATRAFAQDILPLFGQAVGKLYIQTSSSLIRRFAFEIGDLLYAPWPISFPLFFHKLLLFGLAPQFSWVFGISVAWGSCAPVKLATASQDDDSSRLMVVVLADFHTGVLSTQISGAHTKAQQEELNAAFKLLADLVGAVAKSTGLGYKNVQQILFKMLDGASAYATNDWNTYQALFADPEYHTRERRRIDPDFSSSQIDGDPPSRADVRRAYTVFVQSLGRANTAQALQTYAAVNSTQSTHQARRAQFRHTTGDMGHRLERLERLRYQGIVVVLGPHVNEDKDLAFLQATSGLELQFTDVLDCDANDLIGLFQSIACRNGAGTTTSHRLPLPPLPPAAPNQRRSAPKTAKNDLKGKAKAVPASDSDNDSHSEHDGGGDGGENVDSNDDDGDQGKGGHAARDRKYNQQQTINTLRHQLSQVSQADVGLDIFRELGNNSFAWMCLVDLLRQHGYCIHNYPTVVRFPSECARRKGIADLRKGELIRLLQAVKARDNTGHAGLHIEKRDGPLADNELAFTRHDYSQPPPPLGARDEAHRSHWQSSRGVALENMAADGCIWLMTYNRDAELPTLAPQSTNVSTAPAIKPKAKSVTVKAEKTKVKVQNKLQEKAASKK